MKNGLFFILFLIFPVLTDLSAYGQVRKYSNEFLAVGIGARALGMSNSYIATVDDATSGYWNPAGLTGVKCNVQVAAMHSEYFAGIAKYEYGSFASPTDSSSVLGVSFIRLAIDDIPNTIELIEPNGNINYNKIRKFSAADNALYFSYAKKMKVPGLRIGANAKIIYRKVGDFASAWGFGLDAGAQYDYMNWRFAAMARDITGTFNAWSYSLSDRTIEVFSQTGNDIPENSLEITTPKIIIGAAREFIIKEKISVLAEMDADITTDGKRNVLLRGNIASLDPHLGLEAGYKKLIFLRGGIGNLQRIKSDLGNREILTFQPNIGIGIKIKNLTIDYALTDIGDQSVALYSNVFSLKLDLYKKVK